MNRKSILVSSLVFGLLMASAEQCHLKNRIGAVAKEEASEESKVNALKSANGKSNLLESISEERVRSLKGAVPPVAECRRQPLTEEQHIERMLQRLPDTPQTDPQLSRHELLRQGRQLADRQRRHRDLERRVQFQRELAEQRGRQQELAGRLQLLRDQLIEQQLIEQPLVEQLLVERRHSGCCGCFGYR